MFFTKRQGYNLLAKDEEKDGSVRTQVSPSTGGFKPAFYILLATNLVVLTLSGAGLFWQHNNTSEPASLIPSPFPPISLETQLFTPNDSFYKELSTIEDEAWLSLFPTAGGFVQIDNPEQYGLSGGFPLDNTPSGEHSESYCVSVFHQLHCLDSIRAQIENPGHPHHSHHEPDGQLSPKANELHIAHCLDYLRQSIMCCGDMSLEKAAVKDGKVIHAVSGWGNQHTCKKWDEVHGITEAMHSF